MLPSDKTKTRVGAVAIVAGLALATFNLATGGVHLGDRVAVNVAFDEVGALQEGADVMIAGRVVGEVTAIALTRDGALAHVAIEKRFADWAPTNAEIHIASKGLLSKSYVEIGPPPKGEAPARAVSGGETLVGVAPVRIELVVLQSVENTKQFRALLIELRPAVSHLMTELDALAATLEAIEDAPGRYAHLRQATAELIDRLGETRAQAAEANLSVDRLRQLAKRTESLAASIGQTLAAVRGDLDLLAADLKRFRDAASAETMVKLGLALARAERLVADYRKTAALASDIMAAIDRGEGTVGGLLHDPEFIDEAKQLGRILKRQPWRLFGTNREKIESLEP